MLAPQDYEQYDVLNAPGSLVSGFTTGCSDTGCSDSGPWPAQSLMQPSTAQDGTSSQELQQGPVRTRGAAVLTGRPLTAAGSVRTGDHMLPPDTCNDFAGPLLALK